MAVSDVIASLTTGSYSVSRPGSTTYVDGIKQPDSPIVFSIDAVVQPVMMRGRDLGLQALAEGQNEENLRQVYTTTAMQVRDDITIDSETWRVIRVETYTLRTDTHYECIVARQAIP